MALGRAWASIDVLPNMLSAVVRVSALRSHTRADYVRRFHERGWAVVPYRAMWPVRIVVSTPSLQLFCRIRKAQEPMGVQTFRPELAVEGFDEAVVRRLARP